MLYQRSLGYGIWEGQANGRGESKGDDILETVAPSEGIKDRTGKWKELSVATCFRIS